MLLTSYIINWNVTKIIEPTFKSIYIFSFLTEKNYVKVYVILIDQIELVFRSYENQKETKKQINWIKLDWL